jgi:hypothetical protein
MAKQIVIYTIKGFQHNEIDIEANGFWCMPLETSCMSPSKAVRLYPGSYSCEDFYLKSQAISTERDSKKFDAIGLLLAKM